MERFAVIGNPIAHSLSPFIHQRFAEQTSLTLTYEKICGDHAGFEKQVLDFFAQKGKGLNVTLPFKQRAFEMAKESTLQSKKAKAGNTLWMKSGELWVDNTDGIGLIRDLNRYMSLKDKNILILGGGGAARGIIWPLMDSQPAKLVLANRTADKLKAFQEDFPQMQTQDLAHLRGAFDLVINATSASLQGESIRLPPDCLQNKPLCYDLSYKQQGLTAFVDYAKSQDCPAQDGLGMLVEQAAEAFSIWNGVMPDALPVLSELRTIQKNPELV